MNFLAHLYLAGEDEGLRLGAMLGDFVRGKKILDSYQNDVRRGIKLHRFIDCHIDALPDVANLRQTIRPPFRRYSGIILDLAFDHELARNWPRYSDESLEAFDQGVRDLLAAHADLVPDRLRRFMVYADRHGLFAAYRDRTVVLSSLRGIGTRLSRPNPLHRADEIWDELAPRISVSFEFIFRQVQSAVTGWLNSRSTMTGS